MVWVRAPTELIHERLKKRADWVSPDYSSKIAATFEEPKTCDYAIDNDGDKIRVDEQLKILCSS